MSEIEKLRTTVLEQRLGAMRLLNGMLIAHLADNGLIDLELLRGDLSRVIEQGEPCDLVASDMAQVFGHVDHFVGVWERDRQ